LRLKSLVGSFIAELERQLFWLEWKKVKAKLDSKVVKLYYVRRPNPCQPKGRDIGRGQLGDVAGRLVD